MKGLLIGGVVVGGIVMGLAGSYISNYNKANTFEKNISAQYKQNQNALSALTLTVMETAQVPSMYKDDLKEVISSGLQGRYGEGGSKAFFQALTENYPGQLEPKLYENIQIAIESGRKDFAQEQKMLIDKVRVYETSLGYFWSGTMMSMAGYPKINLEEFKVIVSNEALQTFTKGVDSGMKLR